MKAARCAALFAGAALTAFGWSAEAMAQPSAADILTRACKNRPDRVLTQGQIAEALVIEAGGSPQELVRAQPLPTLPAGATLGDAYEAALVAAVRSILENGTKPLYSDINQGVQNLARALPRKPEGVQVTVPAGQEVVVFGQGAPTWSITCGKGKPSPSLVEELESTKPLPLISIRETAEELWLRGEKRESAGAFQVGFERSRSRADDDSIETETSLTIDGTVGLRLTKPNPDLMAYLFATYNLQQDRSDPPPELEPDESESDDDTNALAVGAHATFDGCVGGCTDGSPITIDAQPAAVFDFAKDSSRLRFRLLATPRQYVPLGLCGLNGYGPGPLRPRCEISFESEGGLMLSQGEAEPTDQDDYLALGARASIEFFLLTGDDGESGFLASVRGRYLPVVAGRLADIERIDLKLAHRFWTGGDVGIDVGFTFSNGTNELSFEKEDILTFGVGIVY